VGEGVSETAAPTDAGQLGQLAPLFRVGGRGGGGGGFGGGAPVVNTGDYLLTITAGGERARQTLRVERLVRDGVVP
jgi:hypothetical protein